MSDFAKNRSTATRWMYDRKDRPVDWWRWTVLTAHNNDPEGLKLDERTAFLIFADLVHDGLLVPVVAPDGYEAYTINPGKDSQWEHVMHPWRHWVRRNTGRVIEWIISGIVGGIIGICLGLWWEALVGQ